MAEAPGQAALALASTDRWATRQRYELLGTSFEVLATSDELGARVHRLLLPFCGSQRGACSRRLFLVDEQSADGYHLFDGDQLLYSSVHPVPVLSFLVSVLNAESIQGFGGFAAHAGVVADASAGIALLATSGVGKSTMVAASLSIGLQYVSDEALCLSFDTHRIVPYPKPLQLSSYSRNLVGLGAGDDVGIKAPVTYRDIGGQVASPPVELTHLVRLVRRPGPMTLTPVPPSDGVVWLLELAFNHFKNPKSTFELVTEVAARSQTWRLEYEDAREAVGLLEQRLLHSS